ncbi:MAG: GNAT family N-acetyltransferase [Tumebacillaceae bacterium]
MATYWKECYVLDEGRPVRAVIRNYTEADFAGLLQIQQESFPPPFPQELLWNEEQLNNHITLFPEGALCVEIAGELAGSMTGLRVKFDSEHPAHTWDEITDSGYIRNHNPEGDTLYVVDIGVRPTYRKLGLGKLLMQSMYEMVVHLQMMRLLGGGRMSGFHQHADKLSAEDYLAAVLAGELKDPVITFLLRCGRTPIGVVANYLEDEESCNYAALMEWRNPFFRSEEN